MIATWIVPGRKTHMIDSMIPPFRLLASALLASALSSLPLPGASPQEERIPPQILARANAEGSVRVIVRLRVPAEAEGALSSLAAVRRQREGIARAGRELLDSLLPGSFVAGHRYETIPYVSMEASPEAIVDLESAPAVEHVEEDRPVYPVLAESTVIVGATAAWAAGYTGSGWSVAVIDTGVDKAHDFLKGKVVSEACYSYKGQCPDASKTQIGGGAGVPCTFAGGCAHGTHVAGIAAGHGGVAPGASIISLRIFSKGTGAACVGRTEDPCVIASTSDLIAALERVYKLSASFDIASVNLSLGSGRNDSEASCDAANAAVKAAIDNLRSVGVATVAASGNDGYADALIAPACISTAVSVGASTKTDGIIFFSNSAPFLDLVAPGYQILSSVPGNRYSVFSGTSMAAPHVAGAWAIRKQSDPRSTVPEVLNALVLAGVPLADSRNGVVTPRLSVNAALVVCSTAIQPASGSAPLPVLLTGDVTGGEPPYIRTWDFGDGSATWEGENAEHTYDFAGTYEATMTAADQRGVTCSSALRVSVAGPWISSVSAASDPFRLKVNGSGFPADAVIQINGIAVPQTRYKSATKVIAYKGSALKSMLPKGVTVQVTVVDPGGATSRPVPFTR